LTRLPPPHTPVHLQLNATPTVPLVPLHFEMLTSRVDGLRSVLQDLYRRESEYYHREQSRQAQTHQEAEPLEHLEQQNAHRDNDEDMDDDTESQLQDSRTSHVVIASFSFSSSSDADNHIDVHDDLSVPLEQFSNVCNDIDSGDDVNS
jgi:hypothetical protein